MKGSSKVIMGVTLITVMILVLVLGLALVLLAELYCSLLLRRRQPRQTTSNIATSCPTTTTNIEVSDESRQHQERSVTPSLSSFYAQGVLHAPRSFLFPSVHVNSNLDLEKQQHSLRTLFCEPQTQQPSSSYHEIRHAFSVPTSATTFVPLPSPRLVQEVPLHCSTSNEDCGGNYAENYIYICNPIYDNDGNRVDTPFETPDSSPSRLENMGSSREDDVSSSSTPLTPMKKLPAEACSVSLKDARSLVTSGSDSNSNIYGISSSSSSGSPCTSPSW